MNPIIIVNATMPLIVTIRVLLPPEVPVAGNFPRWVESDRAEPPVLCRASLGNRSNHIHVMDYHLDVASSWSLTSSFVKYLGF